MTRPDLEAQDQPMPLLLGSGEDLRSVYLSIDVPIMKKLYPKVLSDARQSKAKGSRYVGGKSNDRIWPTFPQCAPLNPGSIDLTSSVGQRYSAVGHSIGSRMGLWILSSPGGVGRLRGIVLDGISLTRHQLAPVLLGN